jgi:hypothetical protein
MTTKMRWGWGILIGLSVLLVVNGVGLYLVIVETQTERTLALLLTGFAALSLAVTVDGRRHGGRAAWRNSWVLVGTLVALGLHMLRGDRVDLQVLYLGMAAVALVGQLLARPADRSG